MEEAPRHPLRPLTPHQRGERQTLVTFVGAIAIVVACGFGKLAAPDFFDGVSYWGLFPLMILWIGYARIARDHIRCPVCGKGIFQRGPYSFGWPERVCGQCGRDLQIPDREAR